MALSDEHHATRRAKKNAWRKAYRATNRDKLNAHRRAIYENPELKMTKRLTKLERATRIAENNLKAARKRPSQSTSEDFQYAVEEHDHAMSYNHRREERRATKLRKYSETSKGDS